MRRLLIPLLCILLLQACMDPCSNSVKSKLVSPDGKYCAIIFDRDCDATTRTSRQVSIVLNESNIVSGVGNIFILDGTSVLVYWDNAKQLRVVYSGNDNKVFKNKNEYRDIRIVYQREK
jgi:hypothetical protein